MAVDIDFASVIFSHMRRRARKEYLLEAFGVPTEQVILVEHLTLLF